MFTGKNIKTGLLLAFALETLCATYCLEIPGYTPFFSILYLVAGIWISFLILSFPQAEGIIFQTLRPGAVNYFKPVLWLAMVVVAYFICRYWFDLIPIDKDYADMLPVIRVMDQRFIAGQWNHVYDPIPEIWNGTRPIYLPAMWIPFTPALVLDFDMRWITVGCLLFSFTVFLLIIDFKKNWLFSLAALAIALILFWWLLAQDDAHGLVSMSEEGIVILYYVLLVVAICSGNIWFIAVAAALCLLSRYALVGWVPAFAFYLWLNKEKKKSLVFLLTAMLSFLILFVLPFGWRAFQSFLQLPGSYIEFARTVWKDSREVFWLSLGFAKFFGPDKTAVLHHLLVLLSFSIPVLFVVFCFYRSKKKKLFNIPLATLKISVVVFYNFIDVPYLYLFYTSSFISLIAVAYLIRATEVSDST